MIEPLSEETLEDAKKLANSVFPLQTRDENSDFWLTFSLERNRSTGKYGAHLPQYWVYLREGKVIGVIGLYELIRGRKDVVWLGWFCVDPKFRGRGVGSELLEHVIAAAKSMSKKFLRLYTSDDPIEAAAQKLYEKRGFVITKGRSRMRGKHTIFYRELALT